MTDNMEMQSLPTHEFVQKKVDTLRKLSKFSPFVVYILTFLFFLIMVSINNQTNESVFIIALSWAAIIGTALNFAIEILVYMPLRMVQFNDCLKRMNNDMTTLVFNPTQVFQTRKPLPSLIAVNRNSRKLYLQNSYTEYRGLILDASQIISAKVEREVKIHTRTRHGGNFSFFSGFGFGFTSGGSSYSRTEVKEYAFLEIHYDINKDTAPVFAVIPFDTDRRSADSMLVAIEQICSN